LNDGNRRACVILIAVGCRLVYYERLKEAQQCQSNVLMYLHKGNKSRKLRRNMARDEATIVSDVDISVTMTMRRGPWFPIGLQRDLEELLQVPVQVVTDRTAFARIVEKDAIPL